MINLFHVCSNMAYQIYLFNVFLVGGTFLTNSLFFQTPVLDFNNQLLAPGGKGTWGSWGKGSSGGTSTKPADSGRLSPHCTYTSDSVSNLKLNLCYVWVFIPRFRFRWPSSDQHSEQVLSLAAAFVLIRLFSGLRQTSSPEVRKRK